MVVLDMSVCVELLECEGLTMIGKGCVFRKVNYLCDTTHSL